MGEKQQVSSYTEEFQVIYIDTLTFQRWSLTSLSVGWALCLASKEYSTGRETTDKRSLSQVIKVNIIS